jgi:hypothetical protein
MNPIIAFKQAMFFVSGLYSSKTMNKPGAVIERLSSNARQALTQLKSDDIGNDSPIEDLKYYIMSEEYEQKQKISKELLEFDRKIASSIPSQTKYDK